jgi:7-keto-8-aminopelargonate synthetase-like enzyme
MIDWLVGWGLQEIIDHIRLRAHSYVYSSSMSPPVTGQIMESMRMMTGQIGGDEGQNKIRQLKENTRYFRQKVLIDMPPQAACRTNAMHEFREKFFSIFL